MSQVTGQTCSHQVVTFGKALLYTKGGADPTFASAKVKNAIGRIGILFMNDLWRCFMHCSRNDVVTLTQNKLFRFPDVRYSLSPDDWSIWYCLSVHAWLQWQIPVVYDLGDQKLSFVVPIPEQIGTSTMHFSKVSGDHFCGQLWVWHIVLELEWGTRVLGYPRVHVRLAGPSPDKGTPTTCICLTPCCCRQCCDSHEFSTVDTPSLLCHGKVQFWFCRKGDVQVSGENCPESKGTNMYLNYYSGH